MSTVCACTKVCITDGRLSKTYVKRLRKIWSSYLNSKHKVQATNFWTVSIFRYFYSHLKWSRRDLELLDRKTRAFMRQYKSHHYGASSPMQGWAGSAKSRPFLGKGDHLDSGVPGDLE